MLLTEKETPSTKVQNLQNDGIINPNGKLDLHQQYAGHKVYVLNLKISTFSTTLLQPLRSLVDDMVAMSSLDLVRKPGWGGEILAKVGVKRLLVNFHVETTVTNRSQKERCVFF